MSFRVLLDRALAVFDKWAKRVSLYVPFTAPYDVRTAARSKKGWPILDVGCGRGEKLALFNKGKVPIVGADIWLPYLRECQVLRLYDSLVLCDVRFLPFHEKSFDLVICLELLEHLKKDDAIKLLGTLEHIARRKVILSMPLGTHVQHAYDDNPYQEHVSRWTPSEMRHLGYRVRVNGIRNTAGETGLGTRIPSLLSPLWRILSVLAGPVVNLCPQWGGHMVCSKTLSNKVAENVAAL